MSRTLTEREMIESIPKFERSDGRELGLSNEFIKEKLHNALNNTNIICLARGEGRSHILNEIVFHPEILFDWGEKSVHAFLDGQNERVRRFCDPEVVDKDLLIEYLWTYRQRLSAIYEQRTYLRCDECKVKTFEENLIQKIEREQDDRKLLWIKEWLIYALHTMGEEGFKKITPCVSCSYGQSRFRVARKFGRGRNNKYYVVMDSWVPYTEEGVSYKTTDYVNNVLAEYNLRWFSNRHNEIMLKYGIFPQQLVGYYLFEKDELVKYVINKHYVEKWINDKYFEIGDYVYIDQIIDFDRLGPYNTVYSYDGKRYSIAERRN